MGKGGKERYLPVYDNIKNTLLDYLEFARNELLKRSKKVIPTFSFKLSRGPLTPRGVRVILNNINLKAANDLKISPHMLRHSFATHL